MNGLGFITLHLSGTPPRITDSTRLRAFGHWKRRAADGTRSLPISSLRMPRVTPPCR